MRRLRPLTGVIIALLLMACCALGLLLFTRESDPVAPGPVPSEIVSPAPSPTEPSPDTPTSRPTTAPTRTGDGSGSGRTPSLRATTARSPSQRPPVRQTDPDVVPTYPNCSQMRLDHPAGVERGHPAYRPDLDRDDDGYACEPE